MSGVIGCPPCPLSWPRHDVQIVEVVAGSGHRRPMVTVRDNHDVARAYLRQELYRARRRAVDALVGDPGPTRWPGGDFEVINLLQLRLFRTALVVLVRRVGRPVAAGREHFAHHEPVGRERARHAVVHNAPRAVAGSAVLNCNLVGRLVAHRQGNAGFAPGHGEPPTLLARYHDGRTAWYIREIRGPVEDAGPAAEHMLCATR